ncbi:MAG: hypothetical protein GYA20_09040 [Chloroflexi bacterium]|jgi:hypothetical protein|nr:hypothetical protein [Chloroflexota bacterium]
MEVPMEDVSRNDIRTLLKTFGIQADEEIMRHLFSTRQPGTLHLRITLDDLTDYGDTPPGAPLHVEVFGDVRR